MASDHITKADLKEELGATRLEFKADLEATKTDLKKEFKADLEATKTDLKTEFKADLEATKTDLKTEFKADMQATRQEFKADLVATKTELKAEIAASEKRIVDLLTDRLTEAIRDTETRLLKAFYDYSKASDIRFRKIEADHSNLDASTGQRLAAIELRMVEFEKRLNDIRGAA